jgi:hypothetical protein
MGCSLAPGAKLSSRCKEKKGQHPCPGVREQEGAAFLFGKCLLNNIFYSKWDLRLTQDKKLNDATFIFANLPGNRLYAALAIIHIY